MLGELKPWELPPGTMVQGWRIVRRIGRGGYAVVYEVENEGKRYALKLACQTERSLEIAPVQRTVGLRCQLTG